MQLLSRVKRESPELFRDSLHICLLFAYMFVFRIGNIFFHAKRPVDVKRVFMQRQHKYNQNEECVEHGEEKDGLVS